MDKNLRGRFPLPLNIILLFCSLFLVNCASPPIQDTELASANPTTISTPIPLITTAPSTIVPPAVDSSAPPTIDYFRTAATEAAPGDTIILEWASSGADRASIQSILPNGQLSPTSIDVDTTGSITYQISPDDQNVSTLMLYIWRAGEPSATAAETLMLKLNCQTAWFFSPAPESCPETLRTSNAAEQHFEHGVMLWVEEFYWSDSPSSTNNRTIYVFIDNDTNFRLFTDEWINSLPASDPQVVAPANRYQPMRSFGKVWRENPEIQERLGWAIAEQKEFVTQMQPDSATPYPHLYISMQDGSVRNLWPINYSWEPVP